MRAPTMRPTVAAAAITSVTAALLAPLAAGALPPARPPLPGHVVDVVAGDYFFRAPDTIPAGLTTFRLRSLGGGHGAWVIRLDPGHRVDDLVASARAGVERPRWAHNLGGPAFPPPNGSANATLVLEPGEYALVCYVEGGAKGKTPPHYQLGMFHRLVVRPSPRTPGAPPRPDVVVRMVDHAFRFSAPLRPGRRVVRVVNAGTVMHEFRMQRVLPGHTGAESLAWTPGSGLPPVDVDFAAVATLPPGGAVTTTLDVPAGVYTLFCVPQLRRGMKRAIRVPSDEPTAAGGQLALSVTDTTVDSVTRVIAPGLTLELWREAGVVRGTNAGWDVAVRDAADTAGFNLLYPSLEWHGPYLNQVYAWSEATNHFGRGVRTMEVRGHPWLVDVECVRCTVTGAVPDSARFTAGTLRVAWRRDAQH